MTDDELVQAILSASPAKLRRMAEETARFGYQAIANGDAEGGERFEDLAAGMRRVADEKEQSG